MRILELAHWLMTSYAIKVLAHALKLLSDEVVHAVYIQILLFVLECKKATLCISQQVL